MFGILPFLFLTSCNGDRLDVDISDVSKETEIIHFGEAFYDNDSTAFYTLLGDLVQEYPLFFTNGDSLLWVDRRFDRQLNQLRTDVGRAIPSSEMSEIEFQIRIGFKHYYYHFPEQGSYSVYTYINNLDFNYPVLCIDSLNSAFIGLDIFMGPDHPAYSQIPAYISRRFDAPYIAPKLFEELALTQMPDEDESSTLVSDMIRMGIVRYFQEAMLRDVKAEILLGYTPEQLEFCQANEATIWTYLVEKQLLFDTSIDTKRRFMFEAPFSKFYMQIDNMTPGRIGEWIGWNIVHSYMDNHPDATLSELIRTTDYEKLFRESKYKPER